MKPLTACAGHVVHHPTTPTFFPREPRMSHTGRALQRLDVVGASPAATPACLPARSRALFFMKKSEMPCLLGTLPVAMLAQMIGLFVSGSSERTRPEAPRS